MIYTQKEFASLLRFHFEKIVREEELFFKSIMEASYTIPELALGYLIGKSIFTFLKTELKGNPEIDIKWTREDKLEGSYAGLCDMVFTFTSNKTGQSEKHLIEFKLQSTLQAYQADLNKLFSFYIQNNKDFEGKVYLYFCALEDLYHWQSSRCEQMIQSANSLDHTWDTRYLDTFRFHTHVHPHLVTVGSVLLYPAIKSSQENVQDSGDRKKFNNLWDELATARLNWKGQS